MLLDCSLDLDRAWSVFESVFESAAVFQRRAPQRMRRSDAASGMTVAQACVLCTSQASIFEFVFLLAQYLVCRDALIQLSELCQKLKKELRWEVVDGIVGQPAETTGTATSPAPSPAPAVASVGAGTSQKVRNSEVPADIKLCLFICCALRLTQTCSTPDPARRSFALSLMGWPLRRWRRSPARTQDAGQRRSIFPHLSRPRPRRGSMQQRRQWVRKKETYSYQQTSSNV